MPPTANKIIVLKVRSARFSPPSNGAAISIKGRPITILTKIAKSVEDFRRPMVRMTGPKLNKNAAINAKRRPSIYIMIFLCSVAK